MFRQRMHFFPKTQGAMFEVLSLGEEFNKGAADRGWVQGAFWTPLVGESELIAEFDYPDLATFQRESEEMYADPEMMTLAGKIWGVDSFRTPYSELESSVPTFA